MDKIPFRVPFNNQQGRKVRKIRVVCIGAGLAGVTLSYKIGHELELEDTIDFQIYERQQAMGGTWLANHYPGLSCDVPIHIYALPWAPKNDWTSFMAPGSEINEYILEVAKKMNLNRFVSFKTTVKEAVWDGDAGKWSLTIERYGTISYDQCDVLIGASGTQSTPIKPNIPGLEFFQGEITHTGDYDLSIDCTGKRVGVIGNGSSGIQVFGALQPKAKSITHFIRAPTWISANYMSQFTPNGTNFEYSDEEKAKFKDPQALYDYRLKLERVSNGIFKNLVFNETCKDIKMNFRKNIEKIMSDRLHYDEKMIKQLIPSYQPWCRRLTPGDAYLDALQAENASLIDDPITQITKTGILTKTVNKHQEFDVLVLATGFKNNRIPPWTMRGRKGLDLTDLWAENTDAYPSVAVPEMPNYFTIGCGPNFTIANGPVMSAFGFMSEYILKWCVKIASEGIKSVVVKQSITEQWNVYIQEIMKRTAWNDPGCGSWYKKGSTKDGYRTGITAIYPGSMNHFREMLQDIRGEDFDIEYANKTNMWAQIHGNGLTERDTEDGDLAPYLQSTFKGENML